MAFHAKLSPSSAERWMNCSGSVRLIGDTPNTAGPAAWLGTAVHKVIEVMIDAHESDASRYKNWLAYVHKPGSDETQLIAPGGKIPNFKVPGDWQMFVIDDAAVYGAQVFIDEVRRVQEELFEPEIHSERFLDMTWLDSRLGGTADVTLVESWIHLFDYKNGRVVVEVRDNDQFLNYSVGLLHEHPEAEGVVIHVIQPNAVHEDGIIRTAQYTRAEINEYAKKLKKAAEATSKPNAPLRAGSWCQYCPAKINCPEFSNLAREQAAADFANEPEEPLPLPTVESEGADYLVALARKARWIPLLDAWARDVRKTIMNELQTGAIVPGWKLVRGRSNRAWNIIDGDEDAFVIELCKQAELHDTDLYTQKLKSPAQVEKLGAGPDCKKLIKEVVKKLTHKPPGRLAIAEESDERERVDPAALAAEDFAGVEEEQIDG